MAGVVDEARSPSWDSAAARTSLQPGQERVAWATAAVVSAEDAGAAGPAGASAAAWNDAVGAVVLGGDRRPKYVCT